MGYTNPKIYWLKTCFVLFLISLLHITLLAKGELDGRFYYVVFPYYQESGDLPLVILRCDKAKPIGIRVEMEGVTLDWIGDSVKDIKGVVKTPFAIYDKNTRKVTGNKKVTYRSPEMDLDGIGFDIDQVKQIIHIRSKVKVTLKSKLEHERGKNKRVDKGNTTIDRSRTKFLIERIDEGKDNGKKDSEPDKEVRSDNVSGFDWSSLWWFVGLIIVVVSVIRLVHRKKPKKGSK